MASPFRPAIDLLVQYAEYHRDRRNIVTHLVGVPLIVFGVAVLLAGARFGIAGLSVTLAWVVFALAALWYLTRGEALLGIEVVFGTGVLFTLAHRAAEGSVTSWLAWGVGSFVLGWVIQFVGHWYEGRKPAFVDDLVGLLVAPMFITLEVAVMFGGFGRLMGEIERRAGPTHVRDMAHPVTH